MKKILLTLALVPVLTVTAACSSILPIKIGSDNSSAGQTQSDSLPTQAPTEKSESASSNTGTAERDSGTVGNYEIAIKDYTITKDYDDRDCIVVTYDFTNNSDTNESFLTAVLSSAFQNGIEMETTTGIYENPDSPDDAVSSSWKKLQPGAKLEVKCAYVLSDRSPVDVEIYDYKSQTNEKLKKTFTLE